MHELKVFDDFSFYRVGKYLMRISCLFQVSFCSRWFIELRCKEVLLYEAVGGILMFYPKDIFYIAMSPDEDIIGFCVCSFVQTISLRARRTCRNFTRKHWSLWRQKRLHLICCNRFVKWPMGSNSVIHSISIAPLQLHYYSEAVPTTALVLCRS